MTYEMKTTKDTKSLLAKLLASENVIVEHGKFNTASFDVKNRVLRLPIWKEMSGSLYDLLVLHEVGHALYTPEEGLHDAKNFKDGFKSYLNVVEDARIERKIKNKFPGGRRAFTAGYKDLMERDFFGLKEHGIKVSSLNLIDRINLHYKAGDNLNISFSEEESVFIDRIDKAETFKTVMEICHDLYEYSKDNESETDMSDHSNFSMMDDDDDGEDYEWNEDYDPSDYDDDVNDENDFRDDSKEKRGEGEENDEFSSEMESDNGSGDEEGEDGGSEEDSSDNDETPERENSSAGAGQKGGASGNFDPDHDPESITDKNFRENETDLVSEEAKPYKYVNIPINIPMTEYVVDFKEIHKVYHEFYNEPTSWNEESLSESMKLATEKFREFRGKNKKVIEYLAKEFEMKKAARDHKRAATANSGIIDSEKLHTYKYNEHIFKKLTVVPDGKNHGLVMFVDWSGSMSHNMKGTIDQMMVLVMFCKRVNIPFEVYAFSDSYNRGYRRHEDGSDTWDCYLRPENGEKKHGDLVVGKFSLLNLFSSRMRAKDLHDAYIHMTATALHYDSRYQYGYRQNVPIPDSMHLGGTPLDNTLVMAFSVMRKFIKNSQVDVVNSIFLTDGDSHGQTQYWDSSQEEGHGWKHFDLYNENVIIRDPISKKQFSMASSNIGRGRRQAMTRSLVRFSREVFNINVVNFFLVPRMKKWDMVNLMDEVQKTKGETPNTNWNDADEALRKFRKDKYFVVPEACGFNDQYMILGGKNLEVEEQTLQVGSDATPAQLARAFKSFSKGKLEKRKLLSRFIDMVAK